MDSELNPEAPEFHPLPDPELVTTVEDGFKYMKGATHSSNSFPIGLSHNLYQTYPDFNLLLCNIRNNIVCLSSDIMAQELPSVELKCDNNESNSEHIVDACDNMLERINIYIDTSTGVNQPAPGVVRTPQLAAWNHAPLVTTVKTTAGSASLISAKNIPRPQLAFTEPVDNSDKLFLPRIRNKPNSIKPLALSVIYDDAGHAIGYEHPYLTELRMYSPPEWALEECIEPAFPPPLEEAPVIHVSSPPQLDTLVQHLASVNEIAVDLEHHSYRTYQGITCLIQISTDEGGDFIVDALALRDHLHALNESFTDPKKVKVFHGAEQDVQWLQRDFGVYVVGLFDTHQAARLLRHEGLALRHLLYKYCSINIDKTHQLADWRIRPLPKELVRYARTDTHYLLYVWRRLRNELLQQEPSLLWNAFARSVQIALTTYIKPRLTEDSHMSVYARSGKRFMRAQLTALRAAWAWRDAHARELDESPAYLVPNHVLLSAAETLPRDVQGLRALADPMPPFLNRNIEALHRIILASREVPEEPQVLTMPTGMITMLVAPRRDPMYCAHDLNTARSSERLCEVSERAAIAADVTPPDMGLFTPTAVAALPCTIYGQSTGTKSQLNANARIFLPPYQRYKFYRMVSQAEEVKTLREKEARVAALGRDSEVIRQEVLPELQQQLKAAREQQPLQDSTVEQKPPRDSTAEKNPPRDSTAEKNSPRDSTAEKNSPRDSTAEKNPPRDSTEENNPPLPSTAETSASTALEVKATAPEQVGESLKQRKRKRQDKTDLKNNVKANQTDTSKETKAKSNVRPYDYKNANYEMFRREDGKRKKHPKTK